MPLSLELLNHIKEAYNKCYQIMVSPYFHKNLGDPKGFGSGFVLYYKGTNYFITADHVTSPHNHPDFCKWGKECICGVASGRNDEEIHAQICVPLQARFEFVKASKPQDKDDLVFPEEVDLTFCKAPKELSDCVTLGFSKPYSILNFPSGQIKGVFDANDAVSDQLDLSKYFVIGSILGINNITNDGIIKHKAHLNLTFSRYEDEMIVLTTETPINRLKDWAGLSGSPVVNYNGKLLGMLLKASDGFREIRVLPIKYIIDKLDLVQRMAKTQIDMKKPFIVVGPNVSLDDVKNNPAIQDIIEKIES